MHSTCTTHFSYSGCSLLTGLQYLAPRPQLDPTVLPVTEADPGPAEGAPLPLRLVPVWGLTQVIAIGHDNLEIGDYKKS